MSETDFSTTAWPFGSAMEQYQWETPLGDRDTLVCESALRGYAARDAALHMFLTVQNLGHDIPRGGGGSSKRVGEENIPEKAPSRKTSGPLQKSLWSARLENVEHSTLIGPKPFLEAVSFVRCSSPLSTPAWGPLKDLTLLNDF